MVLGPVEKVFEIPDLADARSWVGWGLKEASLVDPGLVVLFQHVLLGCEVRRVRVLRVHPRMCDFLEGGLELLPLGLFWFFEEAFEVASWA